MSSLTRSLNCDGGRGALLTGAALVLLLLAVAGEAVRDALSLDRDGLRAGEWWRLLSGHFVHLDLHHAVMNVAGLALVWALLLRAWSPLAWAVIALASIAAIDAGLLMLQPRLRWYVGASGLLHGLLVAGLVGQLRSGNRGERGIASVLLAGVALKLAWEQWRGALPLMAADHTVVLPAHLYGAGGGLLAGLALLAIMRRPFSHPR